MHLGENVHVGRCVRVVRVEGEPDEVVGRTRIVPRAVVAADTRVDVPRTAGRVGVEGERATLRVVVFLERRDVPRGRGVGETVDSLWKGRGGSKGGYLVGEERQRGGRVVVIGALLHRLRAHVKRPRRDLRRESRSKGRLYRRGAVANGSEMQTGGRERWRWRETVRTHQSARCPDDPVHAGVMVERCYFNGRLAHNSFKWATQLRTTVQRRIPPGIPRPRPRPGAWARARSARRHRRPSTGAPRVPSRRARWRAPDRTRREAAAARASATAPRSSPSRSSPTATSSTTTGSWRRRCWRRTGRSDGSRGTRPARRRRSDRSDRPRPRRSSAR